jgi:hypothetical protein
MSLISLLQGIQTLLQSGVEVVEEGDVDSGIEVIGAVIGITC